MNRFTWVVAGCLVAGSGAVALAEGQAEIAAKENEEGKAALFANDAPGATAKFRDAVARAPEPKYFFNLCMSLYAEGKFDEAYTACVGVSQNNPSAEQKDKAEKLIGKIKEEAKAQGLTLHLGGGGGGETNVPPPTTPANPDPNNTGVPTNPKDPMMPQPNGNPPDGSSANPPPTGNPPPNGVTGGPPPNDPSYHPVVGRPPAEAAALFKGTKPDNHYTWTIGGDLFAGGGQMGRKGAYGTAMGGARIKADYMLAPKARLGVQGYIQYSHFSKGDNDSFNTSTLEDVDFGVALYKHLCLPGVENLCLTPLIGAHVAAMSPQDDQTENDDGSTTSTFNYVSVGARAEVNLAIAFGPRQEHVLNVALGVNAYTAALGYPSYDPKGMDEGLDKPGTVGYVGVGYTYRFNTPFGALPFVTLE